MKNGTAEHRKGGNERPSEPEGQDLGRPNRMAAEASDASQSYQAGQMSFTGTVQIEYDLTVATP